MFSLLLTTYIVFDNVDVHGSRRPDSDDTEVPPKPPEIPVGQERQDSDMPTKGVQGAAIGGLSAAAGIGANEVRKRRKARAREHEEEDIPGGFEGRRKRVEKLQEEGTESEQRCCIASSVTGTGMIAQVNFLRNYREKIVKKSTRGRRSLNIAEKIYYSMSPPIAKLDSKYEKFRFITRTLWSGPIVSLLLCGMLLFDSGRKELMKLKSVDSKLTLKILTMGIFASIFSISWIIWNCYLVIALIISGTLLANIWQPLMGMSIGMVGLLILRALYSDIPAFTNSKH